jgi:hypothetical protein
MAHCQTIDPALSTSVYQNQVKVDEGISGPVVFACGSASLSLVSLLLPAEGAIAFIRSCIPYS